MRETNGSLKYVVQNNENVSEPKRGNNILHLVLFENENVVRNLEVRG